MTDDGMRWMDTAHAERWTVQRFGGDGDVEPVGGTVLSLEQLVQMRMVGNEVKLVLRFPHLCRICIKYAGSVHRLRQRQKESRAVYLKPRRCKGEAAPDARGRSAVAVFQERQGSGHYFFQRHECDRPIQPAARSAVFHPRQVRVRGSTTDLQQDGTVSYSPFGHDHKVLAVQSHTCHAPHPPGQRGDADRPPPVLSLPDRHYSPSPPSSLPSSLPSILPSILPSFLASSSTVCSSYSYRITCVPTRFTSWSAFLPSFYIGPLFAARVWTVQYVDRASQFHPCRLLGRGPAHPDVTFARSALPSRVPRHSDCCVVQDPSKTSPPGLTTLLICLRPQAMSSIYMRS